MSEDGVLKSAILLMSIGEEEAAEVLKYLGPKEVQKIGMAMAGLDNITREQIQVSLRDFRAEAEERTTLGVGSDNYIRSILTKALGDKATNLIDRILQGGDTSGIESLKWMDSASVAEMIKNEHPQIIATILVHLDYDQASEILQLFTERLRNDVMLRIATLDGVQPHALRELNDVLTKLLSGSDHIKKSKVGGVKAAAEILNFMGGTVESTVIGNIKEFDEELAQRIQDEMFVFEDIGKIDDRGIQLLLREIQSESLIVALKGATPEMREKIFKNMSQRAAEMLRDDLEAKGPVRLSEVEGEQKEILKIVRRLADEGQIVLGGKGEESFV
ncbi:MAG: flagellar motor switch protein FliG [Methylophilaceae bacterium]|jgi:flagellar motor switch protein FliG|uniref:flagellar motor switch protein FliG n=1 Tax=Methylobacillus sp. MM3 TaxID=1848039 RepID=UPI0007E10BEF|nr:flagellar motor switch protein FliG [Methylobacillus sp. MM3]OAJ71999.1 flagellar motor switch protein FliG [Methylobacillus sp. MM3]